MMMGVDDAQSRLSRQRRPGIDQRLVRSDLLPRRRNRLVGGADVLLDLAGGACPSTMR